MKIFKQKDSYLFRNDQGEYHLSIDDYDKLGKEKAIEFATSEINKKINSSYSNKTINFQQARDLGFCKYGINDFCKRLELDISKEYTIETLYDKLDLNTFIVYPSECLKLFTNRLFDKFGGVEVILNSKRDRRTLNLIINHANIKDDILHELSYLSAMRVIENYERVYPDDNRPRIAIEAKRKYIDGLIDNIELSAAESAAETAAESAAASATWAASWAAKSATWAASWAARSAARSVDSSTKSATWAATWAAARSSSWSAKSAKLAWAAEESELNFQIDTLIRLLGE